MRVITEKSHAVELASSTGVPIRLCFVSVFLEQREPRLADQREEMGPGASSGPRPSSSSARGGRTSSSGPPTSSVFSQAMQTHFSLLFLLLRVTGLSLLFSFPDLSTGDERVLSQRNNEGVLALPALVRVWRVYVVVMGEWRGVGRSAGLLQNNLLVTVVGTCCKNKIDALSLSRLLLHVVLREARE